MSGFSNYFEFNFTINDVSYFIRFQVEIFKMEGKLGMELEFTFKIGERGVRMIRREMVGEPPEFKLDGEGDFVEERTSFLIWMLMREMNGERQREVEGEQEEIWEEMKAFVGMWMTPGLEVLEMMKELRDNGKDMRLDLSDQGAGMSEVLGDVGGEQKFELEEIWGKLRDFVWMQLNEVLAGLREMGSGQQAEEVVEELRDFAWMWMNRVMVSVEDVSGEQQEFWKQFLHFFNK